MPNSPDMSSSRALLCSILQLATKECAAWLQGNNNKDEDREMRMEGRAAPHATTSVFQWLTCNYVLQISARKMRGMLYKEPSSPYFANVTDVRKQIAALNVYFFLSFFRSFLIVKKKKKEALDCLTKSMPGMQRKQATPEPLKTVMTTSPIEWCGVPIFFFDTASLLIDAREALRKGSQ